MSSIIIFFISHQQEIGYGAAFAFPNAEAGLRRQTFTAHGSGCRSHRHPGRPWWSSGRAYRRRYRAQSMRLLVFLLALRVSPSGDPIAEQLHSPKWKIEFCLSLPLLLRVVELACSCDNSFECRLEGGARTLLPLKWWTGTLASMA